VRVIITGATGFVGRALCQNLLKSGYEVVALSRSQEKAESILGDKVICIGWDATTSSGWANFAENADAIINLAGANLSAKYWTSSYKKLLWDSRVNAGGAIVQAVMRAKKKPKVLIQASAIGYYGSGGEDELDETSQKGSGFLSDLVGEWEASTKAAEAYGVRRICIRSGVILGEASMMLSLMRLPFKFYVGGYPGNGKQWVSWIHREDEIKIIRFLMDRPQVNGVVNCAAPNPVRMKEFAQAIGKILHKPTWTKAPEFALKLALGDMAKETVLVSQKVLPNRLLELEYKFAYSDLKPALMESLKQVSSSK